MAELPRCTFNNQTPETLQKALLEAYDTVVLAHEIQADLGALFLAARKLSESDLHCDARRVLNAGQYLASDWAAGLEGQKDSLKQALSNLGVSV